MGPKYQANYIKKMINWTVFRKKVFASRKRVKWQAIVCKNIFFNNRIYFSITFGQNIFKIPTNQ